MLLSGLAWRAAPATPNVRSGSALRYAPRMTYRGLLLVLALSAAGCGGTVEGGTPPAGGSGGVAGTAGSGGVGGLDAGPDATGGSDAGYDAAYDAPADVVSDYVDPGCPDAAPPPITQECDLFKKPTTCLNGEACYPFVQYPSGPCQQEQYGTLCEPVGTGHQGDPCGGGDCAGGFVCVLTGAGNQCVQLCHLNKNDCPSGLVCVPIDSDGYGGCD